MVWEWMGVARAADAAIVLDGREDRDGFTEPLTVEIVGLARGAHPAADIFYADFDAQDAVAALDAGFASDAGLIAAVGPLVAVAPLSPAAAGALPSLLTARPTRSARIRTR